MGNILSFFIQILINIEYLLEARHSRTIINRYINNIHYNYLLEIFNILVITDYILVKIKNDLNILENGKIPEAIFNLYL